MIRVTEVLDYYTEPDLLRWMQRVGKAKAERISREAIDIGTIVDQCIQDEVRTGSYRYKDNNQAVLNCLGAWKSFKKEHPGFLEEIISIQDELTDGKVVGHPDLVMTWGIVDVKTSSGIRPKYWTQTAKYLHMSRHKGKGALAVLRLDKKTGEYEYRKIDDQEYVDYEIRVFEAFLMTFKHGQENREVLRQQLEEELLNG